MKTRTELIVAVVVVVLVGLLLYFKGRRYEVVMTQGDIDQALEDRFPVKKRHLLIFEITYQNPEVNLLEEEDRVRIRMDASLNGKFEGRDENLGGTVSLTGGIRYEPETKEFFLDDVILENLGIVGIPKAWLKFVTGVTTKFAREYLETKPVYRLQAKDVKTVAASLLLRDFEVKGQAIHITLGL